MKKVILFILLSALVCQAEQFVVTGRDMVRPDATNMSLALGSGEILAWSSYATSSVADSNPRKYPRIPNMLASTGQADSLYVLSSSTSDRGMVTIDGVDQNWDRQIISATLSATISTVSAVRVGTASYWRRINSVTMNRPALGTVSVVKGAGAYTNDSTRVASLIKVGNAKALIPLFSTWRGWQGGVVQWDMSAVKRGAGASPDTSYGIAYLFARSQADTSWKPLWVKGIAQSDDWSVPFNQPLEIPAKADLFIGAAVTGQRMDLTSNIIIQGY